MTATLAIPIKNKDNCDLSFNEPLTPVMRKLEACKIIKHNLSAENSSRQKLKPLKLWNPHRVLVGFINSDGKSQSPSDKSLKRFAELAGMKIEVRVIKDYAVDFLD